jgi:hypothetical protein
MGFIIVAFLSKILGKRTPRRSENAFCAWHGKYHFESVFCSRNINIFKNFSDFQRNSSLSALPEIVYSLPAYGGRKIRASPKFPFPQKEKPDDD